MIKLEDLLNEDLRRWVKEKWVDQHGRPCGNNKTKGVKKCRPSKKVSDDTPKTWSSFDKKEKAALVAQKRKVGMGDRTPKAESTNIKSTSESFEEFAEMRGKGAAKIASTAEEKGGLALLTWHHFKVKAPYYKKATTGKFDEESAKKEFDATLKSITLNMTPIEFQREVGRLEVLGELLLRDKKE